MIQSTDSLEAANFTHQCGEILLKLSNLSEPNLTEGAEKLNEKLVVSAASKSPASAIDDHRKSPAAKSVAARVNDKLNDRLRERSLVNERASQKNEPAKPGDKSNEQSGEKLSEKLSEKSIDNRIDQRNKSPATEKLSSHKSNDKPIEESKSGRRDSHKCSLKSKEKTKEKSAKKDIPNNQVHYSTNRKRSDIENIFDFNTIKRVKAEMSNFDRPLVFFGPSGSGKSTLLGKLTKEFPQFRFSVSRKCLCDLIVVFGLTLRFFR